MEAEVARLDHWQAPGVDSAAVASEQGHRYGAVAAKSGHPHD